MTPPPPLCYFSSPLSPYKCSHSDRVFTIETDVMSGSDFCAGFVMDSNLSRHTYGFIQSRLVPFYLHMGSACAFFNLTIYAVYHPSDMLDDREAFQVCCWHGMKNRFHLGFGGSQQSVPSQTCAAGPLTDCDIKYERNVCSLFLNLPPLILAQT